MEQKKQSVSKRSELQKNIDLQSNHLNQAFNYLEKSLDLEIEKRHRDCIKVIILKTFLEKEAIAELQEYELQTADEISRNSNFWKQYSGRKN